MTCKQTGSATRTSLIIILVVCAFMAIAVMLLPKGFSDDLTKIGQGTVVVVLTHDKNSVGSMELMTLLNNIRADYAGKVDFLAVDINSREGKTFSRQQDVGSVVLVMFDKDGTRLGAIGGRIAEKDFRLQLDKTVSP